MGMSKMGLWRGRRPVVQDVVSAELYPPYAAVGCAAFSCTHADARTPGWFYRFTGDQVDSGKVGGRKRRHTEQHDHAMRARPARGYLADVQNQ